MIFWIKDNKKWNKVNYGDVEWYFNEKKKDLKMKIHYFNQ